MSDGILMERVNANLNRLRFARINALLPVMLETAQQKTWSYPVVFGCPPGRRSLPEGAAPR